MMVGALCGLLAALLQSLSYIASRHYIAKRQAGAGVQLLIIAHLCMGIMSSAVLIMTISPLPRWAPVLLPIVSAAVFNVFGQLGLMRAIKYAEPSRVSPLLTFKLFIPALLATLIGQPVGLAANRSMTPWQWLAVLLCVLAGASINRSGGRMNRRALVAVLCTAACFAVADWCIGLTVAAFLKGPQMSVIRASLLCESCVFVLLGLISVLFLPLVGSRSRIDWRDAFPFSIAWFSSMICLFIAFGQVGIVLGTILQCTRGFMTILIGIGLMYLGFAHIEPHQPRGVVLRRLAAGALMFLAISLYIIRDPRTFRLHNTTPTIAAPNSTVAQP